MAEDPGRAAAQEASALTRQLCQAVRVGPLVGEGRGAGGLIVVDWRGRTAFAHSTPFMPVAWMNPSCAVPQIPF